MRVTELLLLSLTIGVFVGLSAGYLGSLMVLKKMALVGDALSHVALPGLALGILYNFYPFIGAFLFLFGSALIVWHIERITKLSVESIVGAMFTLALAIGILIVPEPDLLEALFGDITKVTLLDTVVAVTVGVFALSLTRLVYKKMVLGMISEELAISSGIKVARTNLVYLLLVSLVVAIGIKIAGSLLVGFLVIVPAATAKNLSSSLYRYALLSSVFGIISSCSGVLLSSYLNLPSGPLVVVSGIAIFIVGIVLKWASARPPRV
jgi:ABC-type Mn2+/Zn2+ transport system permease subunit